MKNCPLCRKPVGKTDHNNAAVYHLACMMEETYKQRGEDIGKSKHASMYKRACKNRAKQTS